MKNTTQQSAHIASTPNGPAYEFTGAVDGEWTNLKNWEDANGNSPASSLPTVNIATSYVISGLVDTIPDGIEAGVGNLTILEGAEIRIPIKVSKDATVHGIIGVGEKSCGSGELDMLFGEKAKFYGVAENRGLVSGSAEFNDNSKQRGVVTGDVDLYHSSSMVKTEEFDSPRCEGDFGLTMHNDSFAGGCIASNLYLLDSSHIDGDVLVATTVLNINNDRIVDAGGDAHLRDDSYLDGDGSLSATELFMFERSHIKEGYTVVADCTISGPDAYNAGTIDGDALFVGTLFLNMDNVGTVTGTITFIGDIPEDAIIFTMNGSNVWNYDTSAWVFTAPGPTWTFSDSSSNIGNIVGVSTFNNSSTNAGIVSSGIFNDTSYNTCLLGSVTGTATYNGLTGPVSPYYYVLGQCTNLDISGNGFWNGHAYYLGALQPNGYNTYHYYINDVETTLNSEGNGYWNSQYYYLGNVFEPTLQIFTGSVNGDWNNLGNWKPDAGLPLLAGRLPLSTEAVELWASVTTNGGSQPTVTNLLTGTFAPGQTFMINLTVLGTATFSGDSINIGTITGNAIFNGDSSNNGTISGNATFNDTSDQLGTVTGTTTCNTSGTC